ncbi:MAG: hypothetical protein KBB39_14610 [Phycicoccus sp.]|nr:hypothetical protein [Phycicoccus sp.]
MQSSSVSTSVVVTLVAAGVLALLGSFGIYSAAQPDALVGQSAQFNYGQK